MAKAKQLYSKPIVVRNGNDWFVFFRYYNNATGKREDIKVRDGLNRIQDLQEREAEFNALREARENWLKAGWNPITNTFPPKIAEDLDLTALQQMNFSKALLYGFDVGKKDWSERTKETYGSCLKYLLQAADLISIAGMKVSDIKSLHCRRLLEATVKLRNLGDKGFNKYRDCLFSFLERVSKDEIIDYNPVAKIDLKDEIKTLAHRPPTDKQRSLIIDKIRTEYRPYYRFLAILYGCSIRPNEICGLKIKNLDKAAQMFRLFPDKESSSKTKYEREHVIPDWVMGLLGELNLHAYNPDWYIFSTRNKYGTFLPGPKRMHLNTTTSWWKRIVKDPVKKGGLNQDVNQYSLKKLAGDEMVRLQRQESIDKTQLLQLARMQMQHHSDGMTEIYTVEHKKVLQEVIKKKMPVL